MSTDSIVDQVAEAMWNHLADKQADPKRSICFNVPVRSVRDPAPVRWEDDPAPGWTIEMREIAAAAVAEVLRRTDTAFSNQALAATVAEMRAEIAGR